MQGVMAKDAPSELPVKQIMAELLLETAALVARLNAMQDRIEGENDWAIKVRRKAEWKEERDVSVARLNKVLPQPTPYQPFQHPSSLFGTCAC